MKEVNGARLIRAVTTMVCLHSKIRRLPAMLLCLVVAVASFAYLFESDVCVSAAHHEQTAAEKSSLPLMNSPRRDASRHAFANSGSPNDHLWRDEKKQNSKRRSAESRAVPESYRTLSLDEIAQRKVLSRTPMEFTKAARYTQVVITLPMPDGTFARFRVEESPVMAPELAARFPAIKTYRGRGIDDPTSITRFDMTPSGFHAIVLSLQGTFIIEPAGQAQAGKYVSYHQRDAQKDAGSSSCLVLGAEQASAQSQNDQFSSGGDPSLAAATGAALRTYRLALAATAEYTQTYGGGTVAGALSAMTTTINAVNAIYERDLAIHLTLVANETSIIFTNSATDGYTSDNATSLLAQNQVVLDQRIGSANYDLGMVLDGHVYAYQPGQFIFQGAANYQSVCANTSKGKAVSIFRSTEPSTITAIYVAAHELGHMFGALHSFNGTLEDCGPSRFAQLAYEPGSGSTIMGYWGGLLPNGTYYPLCGAEGLSSNDTYFHAGSIEQIVNYTTFGSGGFCPVLTGTGNNPPEVNAGADYTIPANTPFTLTATASDSEGDALTYCWEEYDLGAAGPPHTDNGNRPIFRSFAPVTTPVRTFPQVSDILSGAATFGESLPSTTRSMNFRVTVRDNHAGTGGVNTGAMWVNVRADSGPFVVTQPGASATWTAGSNQTVSWNVANTSSAPVSCANVRVLLSIDGGSTFPVTLKSSTANTGAVTVSIPNTPTSTARIKVEAVDNIFFNISTANFTIAPNSTAAPTLLTEENTNRAVALDSVLFLRDSFPLPNGLNFSFDQRTRIVLFAVGLELMPGEDISVVTAQAEDAGHHIYPLTVEHVGKVPGLTWLTQINIRLPDGLAGTGDLSVRVSLRGAASNKVDIGIR